MKIVYHPLMQKSYDGTPAGAPKRLDTAIEILGKHPDYEFVEPRPAGDEQILRAHGPSHLDEVRRDSEYTHQGLLYEIAALAAGGAIMAGEIAAEGEPAFGLIRPPG
ncbi:MAG: histone deacetylase family protein, partial [Candidatus Thorarchaeota archaeon]